MFTQVKIFIINLEIDMCKNVEAIDVKNNYYMVEK
jgi:hypothetical protein